MIIVICADCKHQFVARIMMAYVYCPECGSDSIRVADDVDANGNMVEMGSLLNNTEVA